MPYLKFKVGGLRALSYQATVDVIVGEGLDHEHLRRHCQVVEEQGHRILVFDGPPDVPLGALVYLHDSQHRVIHHERVGLELRVELAVLEDDSSQR